jgi:hypothetical protein
MKEKGDHAIEGDAHLMYVEDNDKEGEGIMLRTELHDLQATTAKL